MENQIPAAATSTIIHFIPSGPIDAASRKAIRSHVTLDVRRKQRQQKLITLQAKPSKQKSLFFEENLCRCLTVGYTVQDTPPAKSVQSRSALQRQLLADSYKICTNCRGTQFSALSEHGMMKAAKTHPTIVALLQTGFDPLNSMPELPNLSPGGVRAFNDIKAFVITFLTPGILKTVLFPAAIQTPSILMSFLYSSCWNLVALRDNQDTDLAKVGLMLKREAIRQINIRLSDPKLAVTTETIGSIGWLSAGVMGHGESTAVEEIHAHEKGLLSLLNQGPSWSPDDMLGKAIFKILVLHEFTRAVFDDVSIPEPILITYGSNHPAISKFDTIAESPLFRPLDDFYSIKGSKQCSDRLVDLLHATADYIDATLLLDPTTEETSNKHSLDRYDLMKSRLDPFLSINIEGTIYTDYVYESCRLTTILMMSAIETGLPFSESSINLVEELKSALQKTDIGNAWGRLSGVLYWITLVGHAAAVIGRPQHGYFDSVLRLVMNALIYKSPVFEASTIATTNLVKIKGLLGISRRIREAQKGEGEFLEVDTGHQERL